MELAPEVRRGIRGLWMRAVHLYIERGEREPKDQPSSTRLPSVEGRGGGYCSPSRVGKCASVARLEPRRGQATELGGDPALHTGANSTRAKPALWQSNTELRAQ